MEKCLNKIYRILGKAGRTTIPYPIRISNHIPDNSVISFKDTGSGDIILHCESLCSDCTCDADSIVSSLEDYLDELTPEEQQKALIHLSLRIATQQGGTHHV